MSWAMNPNSAVSMSPVFFTVVGKPPDQVQVVAVLAFVTTKADRPV